VTYLLKRFASLMEQFEAQHNKIVYVRTQGTLDSGSDWGDELHPTTQGFKKIVVKIEKALKTVFSGSPKPSANLQSIGA
jgi:hypothetical protein